MFGTTFVYAKELEQSTIPKNEPEPDLSPDMIIKTLVGVRPFRIGGFRIEHERIGSKQIIHNYGHGGAGVTMSWGSAEKVVDLVKQHVPEARSACVIGAGVIGLTSSLLLSQNGIKTRVFSERFTPATTSDIAGAQWAPSLVEVGSSSEQHQMFERVLRSSFARFRALNEVDYGVSVRPNYVEADHDTSFYRIPSGLIPKPEILDSLPFQSRKVAGRVFTTLLIETPILMPRLMIDCRVAGIAFEERKFESKEQVADIKEDVVINCTGIGAGQLFNDSNMVPIRGQLVVAKAQNLPWLLSHKNGYIFPRKDGVILGGTVERNISDNTNTKEGIDKILRGNRGFFHNGE